MPVNYYWLFIHYKQEQESTSYINVHTYTLHTFISFAKTVFFVETFVNITLLRWFDIISPWSLCLCSHCGAFLRSGGGGGKWWGCYCGSRVRCWGYAKVPREQKSKHVTIPHFFISWLKILTPYNSAVIFFCKKIEFCEWLLYAFLSSEVVISDDMDLKEIRNPDFFAFEKSMSISDWNCSVYLIEGFSFGILCNAG